MKELSKKILLWLNQAATNNTQQCIAHHAGYSCVIYCFNWGILRLAIGYGSSLL